MEDQSNRLSTRSSSTGKPRILFVVDRPNWAYDRSMRSLIRELTDEFACEIAYVSEDPYIDPSCYDLVHVCFWGESWHQKSFPDPLRVAKEISSHRWENEDAYGRLSAAQMANRYLRDAATLGATSLRLVDRFKGIRDVFHIPNGYDQELFFCARERARGLRIGWAGNSKDPCKGLKDILEPAIGNDFAFSVADGSLSAVQMREFYNSIDVLCIASTAEGEPLTLIEAMACGCFIVSVDVGIVPELVEPKINGLIVPRTDVGFRSAFLWCTYNLERVRAGGILNAEKVSALRSWSTCSRYWRHYLRAGLVKSESSRNGSSHV